VFIFSCVTCLAVYHRSSWCSHLLAYRTQAPDGGRNSNKNRYKDTQRYARKFFAGGSDRLLTLLRTPRQHKSICRI